MASNNYNDNFNDPSLTSPKVDVSLAQKRAGKKGDANRGNPRAKKVLNQAELQGFTRGTVAQINAEPERMRREQFAKIRRARRQQEQLKASDARSHSIKKIAIICVVCIFIASLIGGAFYLLTSDALQIQEVEFVGADHLTQAECDALAPSPVGENLLTFDKSSIQQGFLRDAWVESVSFNRVFPHKLEVQIKERDIGAVVNFNSGANQTAQSWIITLDGTWIMGLPSQDSDVGKSISQNIFTDAAAAIHIKDCPNGIAPEMGKKSSDETVLNALQILSEFSTDLKDEVSTISASNINATTLQLKNNVEIAFGAAENVREKERIAKEIMSQNDKVVYVNVRSIDRPTWRSAAAS